MSLSANFMFSDPLRRLLHCLEECVGSHRRCTTCSGAEMWVCISIMSHCDDVALASGRTGASVRPSPSVPALSTPGRIEPLRTSGSQGLLGSRISQWEETAEACVASALANQHSHTRHLNLCCFSVIPPTPFFFFFSNLQGSDTHKGLGPQMLKGAGGGDKGILKCLVKAVWAAESSLAQMDHFAKADEMFRWLFR